MSMPDRQTTELIANNDYIPPLHKLRVSQLMLICFVLAIGFTLFEASAIIRFSDRQPQYILGFIIQFSYITATTLVTWYLALKIRSFLSNKTFVQVIAIAIGINILINVLATLMVALVLAAIFSIPLNFSHNSLTLMVSCIFGAMITVGVLYWHHLSKKVIAYSQAALEKNIYQLESRLQPTFFFSSLQAVQQLAQEDSEQTSDFLSHVINFYQVSLQEPHLLSLNDELEICDEYIAIEKIKLKQHIQVNWQVSAYAKQQGHNIAIPSLLIQRFIEITINFVVEERHDDDIVLNIEIDFIDNLVTVVIDGNNLKHQVSRDYIMSRIDSLIDINQNRLKNNFGDDAMIAVNMIDNRKRMIIKFPYLQVPNL